MGFGLIHRSGLYLLCGLTENVLRSWYDKKKLQDRFVAHFTGIQGGNHGTYKVVYCLRMMHAVLGGMGEASLQSQSDQT